jgi:hypothetical protein
MDMWQAIVRRCSNQLCRKRGAEVPWAIRNDNVKRLCSGRTEIRLLSSDLRDAQALRAQL